MFSFLKMKRRVEDLLTVLAGCSGVGVVLCNTALVYETQLSFVNNFFKGMAKKYSNTKCGQIKLKQFDNFRPDEVHLNEFLLNQCKFMPLKGIINDKKH